MFVVGAVVALLVFILCIITKKIYSVFYDISSFHKIIKEKRIKLKNFNKIIVVGFSCSGKSTLTTLLSKQLNLPKIELDSINWKPNWTLSSDEEFMEKLVNFLEENREKGWVIDGGYASKTDIHWKEADLIIYLDYPFIVNFYRMLKRTLRRVIFKEECCNGNYENFSQQFTKDSLFYYLFKNFYKVKARLGAVYERNRRDNLEIITFKNSHSLTKFLNYE